MHSFLKFKSLIIKYNYSLLLFFVLLFTVACQPLVELDQTNKQGATAPVVTVVVPTLTASTSNLQDTSVFINAQITSTGGASITSAYVSYSTSPNMANAINKPATVYANSFSVKIYPLTANTPYYIKVYAVNTAGQNDFPNPIPITTLQTTVVTPPQLSTPTATGISLTSATCSATITNSTSVTAQGFFWKTTNVQPSGALSANTGTTLPASLTSLSATRSGLTASTTYYVWAYATTSAGTTYSATPLQFTTDVKDNGGILTYKTVTIGTQTWLASNLATNYYSDGSPIGTNFSDTTGAYYSTTQYGNLYNYYAVSKGKLAPTGWHVASQTEWNTLISYVTANYSTSTTSGQELSTNATSNGWSYSSTSGSVGNNPSVNNASGFNAYPAGISSYGSAPAFYGTACYFWTSNEASSTNGIYYYWLNTSLTPSYSSTSKQSIGLSVRCIKD